MLDLSNLKNDSRNGVKCAVITGSVTVKAGGLIPSDENANGRRFAEIWTMDSDANATAKHLQLLDIFCKPSGNLRSGLSMEDYETLQGFVTDIHKYMKEHNFYAKTFKTTMEQVRDNHPDGNIPQSIYYQASDQRDRTNNSIPDGGEFGIAYDQSHLGEKMMFVIKTKGDSLKLLNITHPFFLPMRFPLIFLHGESGWSTDLPLQGTTDKRSKRISMREFMQFLI